MAARYIFPDSRGPFFFKMASRQFFFFFKSEIEPFKQFFMFFSLKKKKKFKKFKKVQK